MNGCRITKKGQKALKRMQKKYEATVGKTEARRIERIIKETVKHGNVSDCLREGRIFEMSGKGWKLRCPCGSYYAIIPIKPRSERTECAPPFEHRNRRP